MGRNGIAWGYRTWSLSTGKRIDLWTWFAGRSSQPNDRNHDGSATMQNKLREALFRNVDMHKIQPGCQENYSRGWEYQLTLEENGMLFSQPEYGRGCELNFDVPFKKLLPLMTADGREAVLGIMQGMQ